MARFVLIDQFYLKVFVPDHMASSESRAICRVLQGRRFRAVLGGAVRNVFRRYPSLGKAKVRISA